MSGNLNNNLNRGNAHKANNIRLCRELLRKGKTQRQISEILNVSLPTTNSYCKQIAREIEEKQKKENMEKAEARRKTLERERGKRLYREQAKEVFENAEKQTPEELAKAGFTACLRELQIRLPTMTNEEVMKITVDLWDRVNK